MRANRNSFHVNLCSPWLFLSCLDIPVLGGCIFISIGGSTVRYHYLTLFSVIVRLFYVAVLHASVYCAPFIRHCATFLCLPQGGAGELAALFRSLSVHLSSATGGCLRETVLDLRARARTPARLPRAAAVQLEEARAQVEQTGGLGRVALLEPPGRGASSVEESLNSGHGCQK